jgi:prepilin-type processing-associated H-X9-DG protein
MWRGRILPNPSKVMLYADQANPTLPTAAAGRDLSPFYDGALLAYRHAGDGTANSGRANVIFYDGHGETAAYVTDYAQAVSSGYGAVITHRFMNNLPPGYYYNKPPWQTGE